jgi:hypothetical protein
MRQGFDLASVERVFEYRKALTEFPTIAYLNFNDFCDTVTAQPTLEFSQDCQIKKRGGHVLLSKELCQRWFGLIYIKSLRP